MAIAVVCVGVGISGILLTLGFTLFDKHYEGKVYPNVSIAGVAVGGKTRDEIEQYWERRNIPFSEAIFEFRLDNAIATVSGTELDLGFDAKLSAYQAYLVGRSGNIASDFYNKFLSPSINLAPYFRWKTDVLNSMLDILASYVEIPAQDALFEYSDGKVIAFQPSHPGVKLNREMAIQQFTDLLPKVSDTHNTIVIALTTETIEPRVTTERVNSLGIREKIGTGYSEFQGSIAGRIHNVALAASKFNGVLIRPGETFSFNDAIGDISAATGYQQAYIIKDGRTILGDGGGVCQVSTTLFRAALNAGLPVIERKGHAYRVHYYEEGGYKPGLDATVFSPSPDLKIINDTKSHILIQTKTDTTSLTLTFDLFGTSDGRIAQILNHRVWGESPPPPPLYQDDPTLPVGVTKQVDFAAWGANAAFDYKVTRGEETLQNMTFVTNFRPWQAIFLKGTKQ